MLGPVGALILACGSFLGDQAVHLYQMEHSDLPPTWLEQAQQRHRWIFQVIGLVVSMLGMLAILGAVRQGK